MRETNRLLEDECRADTNSAAGLPSRRVAMDREVHRAGRVQFLDVFTPMLDEEGQPRDELYVEDGLHMSEEGYLLWARLVRPLLAAGEE